MTAKPGPDAAPDSEDDGEENEVLRETRRLSELKAAADKAEAGAAAKVAGGLNWKTAAGIGIGSAALLAAVIYASRKKD
ncbi:MAG: hypothetical protein RLZZ58_1377 [Pseudomonadota bacterium]|jgi:hypothetical protein